MATLEELNKVLTECATALDSCAGVIRDTQLEPVKDNVRKIGHALMQVFEIQQQVFDLKPELKPEGWDDPLPDSEYNRMFGDLVIEVEGLCEAGKAAEALERLESLVFIGPGERLEEKAKGLIAQIRGEYGV